jgi:uncharacterized membrane protein
MGHRILVVVSLIIIGLILVAPAAFAQTATPADGGRACSSAAPCANAALTHGGLQFGALAADASTRAVEEAAKQEPINAGFGLAWVVMGLLALALLYALSAAVLAVLGREVPAFPGGAGVLIPILTIIGLGVALYLTYVETQNVVAVCGPVGDCNAVQASPFAELFGFLPVGLLGALGYVAILVLWFVGLRSEGAVGHLAPLAIFGMALFGVLFSIYLTYLELYIIRAVCIWCLTSAVIMSLVLVLSVGPAVETLQAE